MLLKKIRYTFFIGLLFLLPQFSTATHIVGGEMYYTCLGNNDYQITLTIFRDCYNGSPNAFFDDPASIGIFTEDNILWMELQIPYDPMVNDTLEPVLSDECFVAPPDVCVHTTTYITTVNLPPITGGYQLAYQRCCRNVTISNLINPLDVGATYGVTISEKALEECNSNPQFQEWPPIYICVNEPINFDQSAFDLDGDSIVYKLCTPLTGATPAEPMPQPPNNPPYQPVPWINPPYSEMNMLNGSLGGQLLTINSETGLLTGIPNTIGQFVVGICVEEYRDDELISTTRRDFQYNVGVCGTTTSAFFAPEVVCDNDLLVSFSNESQNADEYLWYFNDPLNPTATSIDPNPTFMYADTGQYTVMLVAEPNNSCRDTAYQTFQLFYNSLFVNFDHQTVECSDSLLLQVLDSSLDSLSTPAEWLWEVDYQGEIIYTSTEQHPTFVFTESASFIVTLTVTSENGCVESYSEILTAFLLEDELPADTLTICQGGTVNLNPDFFQNATYSWTPIETLDNPNIGNPNATPDSTTTYTVQITGTGVYFPCEITQTITVEIPEAVVAEAPPDAVTCEEDYLLEANTNFGVEFFWATDPDFDDVISFLPNVLVTPFGEQTYYLLIRDEMGCAAFDSVTIIGNSVNTDLLDWTLVCQGDSIGFSVQNLDPTDNLTYQWSPPDGVISGINSNEVSIFQEEPGVYYYYVEMENQFGCTKIDSIQIGVIDTTEQIGFLADQQCSGYTIQFTNTSVNAPFYVWHFGDPSNPNAISLEDNPVYTYPSAGNYEIMLTLGNAICPDTLIKTITVIEPLINLDFIWDFGDCSDSVEVSFTDLSVNTQSNFDNWEWWFSSGDTTDIQNPSIFVTESGNLVATLILQSDDGCSDTLTQIIPVELIETSLTDTLIVCSGNSVPLNPTGNPNYEYLWSPSGSLDDPTAPNPTASPLETTTYEVLISNFSGDTCSITRSVTAFVPPTIELTTSNDTSICASEILLFADSDQAVSYTWANDPGFVNIFSEDEEVLVEPGSPSLFWIQVEDQFGCTQTESIEVGSFPINASIADSFDLCINDTLTLMVENLNQGMDLMYNWTPTEFIIEGENTTTVLVNPVETTIFSVALSNMYGCELDLSATVEIMDVIPPLEVIPTIDSIILGQSIQLNATFSPFYNYFWTPSNTLDFNNVFNPIASPLETTTYEVFIEDSNGCSNNRAVVIFVIEPQCIEPFIFIPSGFTPNGDGKNDFFRVMGNSIESMHLMVYNRWGQKIFESNSQSDAWDGTFNGKALPPEVFGYYLRVNCIGGEQFVKKGNVTLLR